MAGRVMCIGQDADLRRLMRNSAAFNFSKRIIQTTSCIDLLASIITKRDAFQLAAEVVRNSFNELEPHEKEELYESFPRTPAEFSQFPAGALWLISAVNHESFVNSENIKQKNPMYIGFFEQIPLVAVAMIPSDHELVFSNDNHPNKRVADTKFGCSHTSKHYYLLNSTTKHFLRLVLSVQCKNGTEERILDCHLHTQNFRTRLEEARRILREQAMSSGDLQLVAQTRRLLELCEKIHKSAVAARVASGSAPTNGGPGEGHATSGDLPSANALSAHLS